MIKENMLKVKMSVYRRTTIAGEIILSVDVDVMTDTPHWSK
jgi:hypothetical protein